MRSPPELLRRGRSSVQSTGLMVRRWAKLVLAMAAAMIAWLVAAPAQAASAPQCDPRGAITFAPPPQLQPPSQSIEQTDDGKLTCLEKLALDEGYEQGDSPLPTSTPEPALVATMPSVLPAAPEAFIAPAAATFTPPAGVHARLERPPR